MTEQRRLTDSHKRVINYLRISITDRCNLRCAYCMPDDGIELLPSGEILSFEEIVRVAEAAVGLGVDKIRITGGEPLIRKDAIDLMERLISMPGIKDFGLTTNGILLAEKVDLLWKAGLRRINISLDTLDPEKFRSVTRGGDIGKVFGGIKLAMNRGFDPVKVNVVAFRGFNDDEVADFGRMALELPIVVRFIERMHMTGNDIGPFLPGIEILEKLSTLGELEEIPKDDPSSPARRFRYKNGQGEIGLISPMSGKFCEGCNRLRLNADGSLQSCLLDNVLTDIKTPLRQGASTEELMEILKNAAVKKPKEHCFDLRGTRKCARAMPIVGG